MHLIKRDMAYVDSSDRRGDPASYRGTLTEPGRESPYRESLGRGEPRSVRAHARRRVRRRRARAARQDRHGVAESSTCAIRCSTASGTRITIAPATPGASIRCTTSRIRRRMRSRASRTRSARWSSRTTGRSTIGSSSNLPVPARPRQIEFARLNLTYTVMSKRGCSSSCRRSTSPAGTIRACPRSSACAAAATRRRRSARSATASAWPSVKNIVDVALLEHAVREDLNLRAPRVMGVLRAAEGRDRELSRGPSRKSRRGQQSRGSVSRHRARCRSRGCSTSSATTSGRIRRRSSSACRPGGKCGCAAPTSSRARGREGPATGEVVELRCTYDPATRGGDAPDGRKVKGTMHWVSAEHAVDAEVRLYDRLFTTEEPGARGDLQRSESCFARSHSAAKIEPSAAALAPGACPIRASRLLLRRPGTTPGRPVFNRTVTLKDSWAKEEEEGLRLWP